MGCLSRIGCLTLGVLIGAALLSLLLITRATGPRYADGVYHYSVDGEPRETAITPEAARRFDAKLDGNLPLPDLIQAATQGVTITEEELNSRLAEELTTRDLSERGARVDRVFVRLTPGGARGYIYTTALGQNVTLTTDLEFRVTSGRVDVSMRDVHAGKLPVDFAVPTLLEAMSDRTGVEQSIALIIPPQVRSIRVEEGRLRVMLNAPSTSP